MSKVTKDAGGWLKPDEAKTGEMWEVLAASESEKPDFNGKPKMVVTLEVKNDDGDVRRVDLNSTSKNNVIDSYGYETNDWVGKSLRVEVVNQKVGKNFKDVLYLTHPSRNVKGELIT